MSDILIKGMNMPECCGYCPFEYQKYCMAKPALMVESADRHPSCPLVPVPPHGRLIDKDAIRKRCERGEYPNVFIDSKEFAAEFYSAPTIIPAEEGET